MKYHILHVTRKYYEWKYRNEDDECCMCGDLIEHHSVYNGTHSPLSIKDYKINKGVDKMSIFIGRFFK